MCEAEINGVEQYGINRLIAETIDAVVAYRVENFHPDAPSKVVTNFGGPTYKEIAERLADRFDGSFGDGLCAVGRVVDEVPQKSGYVKTENQPPLRAINGKLVLTHAYGCVLWTYAYGGYDTVPAYFREFLDSLTSYDIDDKISFARGLLEYSEEGYCLILLNNSKVVADARERAAEVLERHGDSVYVCGCRTEHRTHHP